MSAFGRRLTFLKTLLKLAFGPSFFLFALVTTASGVAAYLIKGPVVFNAALGQGVERLGAILPRLAGALLVAGCVRVLVSKEFIARWLGGRSSISALALAEVAGALTPGGPVAAFALIATLQTAGADRGVLVAYATGWALLGFQRILMWEVPLLGADFMAMRLVSSFLLPILAGEAARRISLLVSRPPTAT